MSSTIREAEMPRLFQQGPGQVSLSGGLPDLSVFPVQAFADLTSRLLRLGGRTLLQYTTPHVSTNLAPAILDLAAREGMHPDADNLIPTAGSQQGLVAVAHVLDGDTMLCESPTYPGALAAFAQAGLDPQPVACDLEGILVEDLSRRVTQLRAAGRRVPALYVVPTFANPTGAVQSPERRRRLIDACVGLDLTIIEDNPYGLLDFDGRHWPALKSLAEEHVVYMGTFSKVFAPGLRTGWIDPPTSLTDELRAATEVLTLSPAAFAQAAIGEFHRRYGWDELIGNYRASYRARAVAASDTLRETLNGHDPTATQWMWQEPQGGFYLWLTSVGPADTGAVDIAAAAGVAVVPGRYFGTTGQHRSSLRLCYANAPMDVLVGAARRLGGVLAGVGTRGGVR